MQRGITDRLRDIGKGRGHEERKTDRERENGRGKESIRRIEVVPRSWQTPWTAEAAAGRAYDEPPAGTLAA